MNKLKMIIILVTEKCNLNCAYCCRKSEKIVTNYNQLDALRYILSTVEIDENLEVIFTGGEPLLSLDIVSDAIELVKQFNKNTGFTVLTNGKLIRTYKSKLEEFFNENNFSIGLSFDGYEKNPKRFEDEDYQFFLEKKAFCTYVIDSQDSIKSDSENLIFLNSKGIIPRVLYNFYKLNELNDISIRKKLYNSLKNVKIKFEDKSSNDCPFLYKGITITAEGRIEQCYKSALYGDLKEGLLFNTFCKNCKYQEVCSSCPPKKAFFKESWCSFMKVLYVLKNNLEVE